MRQLEGPQTVKAGANPVPSTKPHREGKEIGQKVDDWKQQRRKSPEVETTGKNHPDKICNVADSGCKPAGGTQSTDLIQTKTTKQ